MGYEMKPFYGHRAVGMSVGCTADPDVLYHTYANHLLHISL